jgi:phosphoribosyl 1,2-cyclic phosphodiesterase
MRTSEPHYPDVLQNVETGAAMRVLASGSSGNCSVLAFRRGSVVRLVLIDLGLSPRRTFKMLAEMGYRADQIDDAIVTHLDADHFQHSWLTALPPHVRIRMHARHGRELHAMGTNPAAARVETFSHDPFAIDEGVHVHPLLMSHDEAGVATFRIDMPGLGAGTLGFCTDLGHVTSDLVEHLNAGPTSASSGAATPRTGGGGGVDVLAMESNYCPQMQLASDRPIFLKRRIMGGSGHLSNHEALEAIRAIAPREHVVLLHLSRQCNDPALVADLHAGSDYALTISSQSTPTRWISLAKSARPFDRPVVTLRRVETPLLFSR